MDTKRLRSGNCQRRKYGRETGSCSNVGLHLRLWHNPDGYGLAVLGQCLVEFSGLRVCRKKSRPSFCDSVNSAARRWTANRVCESFSWTKRNARMWGTTWHLPATIFGTVEEAPCCGFWTDWMKSSTPRHDRPFPTGFSKPLVTERTTIFLSPAALPGTTAKVCRSVLRLQNFMYGRWTTPRLLVSFTTGTRPHMTSCSFRPRRNPG